MKLEILPEFQTVEYTEGEFGNCHSLCIFNVDCSNDGLIGKVKLLGLVDIYGAGSEFARAIFNNLKTFSICLVEKIHKRFPMYQKSDIECLVKVYDCDLTSLFSEELDKLVNDKTYRVNGVKENWNKYMRPYYGLHCDL